MAKKKQPEVDLNAVLSDINQYQRDVVAEFEALGVAVDDPAWTEWCEQMAEWNAAATPG